MRITLDKVKGKILKTEKAIIREDIEVVPKLENVEVTANGVRKVSEGYAGIGEVLVNVQSGGSGSWTGVFDDDRVYYVGDIVYYDGGIYERTKYSQMVQLPTNAEYWSLLDEVVSGNKAIHTNGTHDVTRYKTIHVAVPDENNWEGEYEDGIAYKYGALVVYNVGVYLALKDTDGTQNPTNEEYWEKLTPLWNDTSDATATEKLVAYGYTFYAGGEKKAGLMPRVEGTVFSSLMLENSGEGLLDINYYADENSYIPNTKGLTRPGTIGTIVEPKFKAENIAEGVTLFGVSGKHGSTPIFDGTIIIESGFTTISGSYVIDESKAYDVLSTYGKAKTFTVNFSAGGSASGMGDSRNFTSMTFDGTYGFIKYDDKAAFAMNGGFAEYNNNYGDGNGARVQFEEGTECRKEFKELFLSIADEYVEPEEPAEELAGTWVFTSELGTVGTYDEIVGSVTNVNFTSNGVNYTSIKTTNYSNLYYGNTLVFENDGMPSASWVNNSYKTITITSNLAEVTNGAALLAWLKANATKQ